MLRRARQIIQTDLWQSALSAFALILILVQLISRVPSGFTYASLLLVLSIAPIATRVRYPVYALAGQLILTFAMALVPDHALFTCWALTQVCLLSLASLRTRNTIIVAAVTVQIVLYATAAINNPSGWRVPLRSAEIVGLLSWTLTCAGVGTAVRVQRKYILVLKDQAARAIESKEIEARRQVAEERMRIARDLHDAVAHQIAVISMFTGLARTTLAASPDRAEEALARAQEATRTVLSELQHILRILREPEAGVIGAGPAAPEQPAPSIDDIPDLVSSFEEIGMTIRFTVAGTRQPRSIATDIASYRVVQEALTNAHKHGDGSAEIQVTFNPTAVIIDITNRRAPQSGREWNTGDRPGFGLTGMRERVRMAGGTLSHGDEGDIYRVRVELPLNDPGARTTRHDAEQQRAGAL